MSVEILLVVGSGLLGLLVGSFLNVVIWRVPRGESVVTPASRCPRCGMGIRARDNVPVLAWVVLGGRCRGCAEPVSRRYPAVEMLTALLFAAVGARLGLSWELPAFLYLAAISVALAAIDIDVRRLPDVIVLPAYVVGLALLSLPAVIDHRYGDYGRALIGMVCLYGVYLLLVLIHPQGMGRGDLKLSGVLGLYLGWLGWSALFVGAFLGFLYGGLVGIALMLTGRVTRKSSVPFGPFMLAGTLTALFVAQPLAAAYLHAAIG